MDDHQSIPSSLIGRETLPPEVKAKEMAYISRRRQASGVAPSEEGEAVPLVGLALSGGGIRSATFSLGVLQILAKSGVLKLADYLSTVSGGGYLGACLTSLMTVPKKDVSWSDANENWTKAKRAFDLEENFPLNDPDQVHHLRRHGDFLITRLGVFRKEVLRAAGYAVLGSASTMAMFGAFLLILVGLLLGYGFMAGGLDFWMNLTAGESAFSFKTPADALLPTNALLGLVPFLAGLMGAVILFFSFLKMNSSKETATSGETVRDIFERKVLVRFAGIMLAIALGVTIVIHVFSRSFTADGTIPLLFFCPIFVCVGALLASWACFLALRPDKSTWKWNGENRSLINGMQGICVYGIAAFLAAAALIAAIEWLYHHTLECSIGGGITLLLTRLFTAKDGILLKAANVRNRFYRLIGKWLPYGVVPLLIILAVVACASLLLKSSWLLSWFGAPLVAVPLVGGLIAILLIDHFVDFNRVSPHYFYRDRLEEAYFKTEARVKHHGLRIIRDDSQLRLCEILDRFGPGDTAGAGEEFPNPAPYHLLQCSLNLPGSRDLARRDRKSDHFIFSREFCGSATTGYVPSVIYRNGKTKLSRAMTISGAAASSAMGFHTSFPLAFVATLFNIRLGYWLENPRCYGQEVIYSKTAKPSVKDIGLSSSRDSSLFWPLNLLRELTGLMDATQPFVNLSDGGHTGDNLGLYPLLQRRCRLIIACDGERDGDYGCPSLAAAIRQIFIDENVIVDIDLNEIRPPRKDRRPRSHFAVGRILYPANENAADSEDEQPTEGWLIYLKASFLNRGEPAAVQSYARKNREFPHQPTADQFFDDDQFEAYRALGAHIADRLLRAVKEQDFRGELEETGPATGVLIKWCREVYNASRH